MAGQERLIFAALGGAGEIGMNTYLYGYGAPGKERLILVDLGVTFPDAETTPGVDLIMADIGWVTKRLERLEAIFITHAHEDHVGALGHLWGRLGVDVHCRRFTAAIARDKMERTGHDPARVRIANPWPKTVTAGPFTVGFVPISHSVPESSALVIDTPAGRVLHSGDFKIDLDPVVGEPFDAETFRRIGADGVQALVCDSTNVFSLHPGRSESSLGPDLHRLMQEAQGMVVATTFASNVARLKTLAEAGRAAGRKVAVVGRAMQSMLKHARGTELLRDFPELIDVTEAVDTPRRELLVLATGSQGEPRAASAQLARGKYLGLEMGEGDTFLFSSKTIPGNEVAVNRILNALSEKGVITIDDSDGRYHVSGHPNRPDLVTVHGLLRPKMVVPIHGEHRHLVAHAALAEEYGMPSVVAPNGTVLDLGGDRPKVVEQIEVGRSYLDGTRMIGALDGVVRDRIRLANRGHVVVSLLFDEDGAPVEPVWVESVGLPPVLDLPDGLEGALEAAISAELSRAGRKTLADDQGVEELVTRAVARRANELIGKKPLVTVMISRLE